MYRLSVNRHVCSIDTPHILRYIGDFRTSIANCRTSMVFILSRKFLILRVCIKHWSPMKGFKAPVVTGGSSKELEEFAAEEIKTRISHLY